MQIANKYRLYPTQEQEQKLLQFSGSTRWLWNYMLDLNQKQYQATKKFIFAYDMANLLPALKREHEWLKEMPAQSLQQKCMDMDRALKAVWRSRFGFPKFKAKGRSQDGFRIPQTNGHIKTSQSHITIPKIGAIKWRQHRDLYGKQIKSITITRDVDHWYVSVLCEASEQQTIALSNERAIGIDLGISSFAALSDGTKIKSPTFLKKKLHQLRKAQRQLAKKRKGSQNRVKAAIRVARIHRTIRFQRSNWLHQLSNKIINQYDLICLEDLKTKSLMKGKKQRSLNRVISDQGWRMFVDMLAYKANMRGKHLTKIDQWAPSSKTCSSCGHKTEKMALDVRDWICPSCGASHDRDTNAALNIKFWGIMSTPAALFSETNTGGTPEINACGDTSDSSNQAYDWHLDVSLKQEAALL